MQKAVRDTSKLPVFINFLRIDNEYFLIKTQVQTY